jgi:hypothetical protein
VVVQILAEESRSAWAVDGSGVTVGVLSESFDCQGGASDGARTGDLLAVITRLQEGPCADDVDNRRGG